MEAVQPAPPAMFGRVVDHVTPLAQCGEIAWPVVARIMVQMRGGKHDAGHARARRVHAGEDELSVQEIGRRRKGRNPPAPSIAPDCAIVVPPRSFAQMDHVASVRALAVLAPTLCAAKADQVRQLGPVDRIQPAVFGKRCPGGTLLR